MSLTYAPGVPPIPIEAGKVGFKTVTSASGAGTAVDFTAFRSAAGDANLETIAGTLARLKSLTITSLGTSSEYITVQLNGVLVEDEGDPTGYPLFGGASLTIYPYDVGVAIALVDGTGASVDCVFTATWE